VDDSRFDEITQILAKGISRRIVVRGLGAAVLGAVGLARLRPAAAAGNGPCARYCVDNYPAGPDRAACITAAARGEGQCPSCGGGNADVCPLYDGGPYFCTDYQTDPANCGGCRRVCSGEAAICERGVCSTELLEVGSPCTADAECVNGHCHTVYHTCWDGGCGFEHPCTIDADCCPTSHCLLAAGIGAICWPNDVPDPA